MGKRGFWIAGLGLFGLAWLARLAAFGRYVTPDELIWVFRSVQFGEALRVGDWPATMTSGHPGVVTTWLGWIGIRLQLLVMPVSRESYEWIGRLGFMTPDNMEAFRQLGMLLPGARLMVTAVNAAGVVVIFALSRRMFGLTVAWLAALLLALDPFVAGLSGLLHVDALMTTFATISLLAWSLAMLPAEVGQRERDWLTAVAGITTALALLTKTPSLLLLPFAGLFVLMGGWLQSSSRGEFGRFVIRYTLIWAASFTLVALLLFPALWSGAEAVLARAGEDASRHIDSALRPTFFMGRIAFDHGPTFYPVAVAFRMSPVVMVGMAFVGWQLLAWRRRISDARGMTMALLLLWSVLFVAGISMADKKFDRYALPIFPALIVAAAYGWHQSGEWFRVWRRQGVVLLLAVQFFWLLSVWPYPLAAYNPLVGGPWLANEVMSLGWGEAIGAAARWAADQPDSATKTAVAGIGPSLAPFFPGRSLLADEDTTPQADYVILTAGGEQLNPGNLAQTARDMTLVHTVRFAGQEQAWVFWQPNPQPPPQLTSPLAAPVTFDNLVQLLELGARAKGNGVEVATRWRLVGGNGRYTVQLTLMDIQGQVWQSSEFPLVNDISFYPEDWLPSERPVVAYEIKLPDAAPPGIYRASIALFDAVGAQLPVLAEDGGFQGLVVQGPDVLVPPEDEVRVLPLTAVPVLMNDSWLDGALRLHGRGELPAQLVTGFGTTLDLYWQAAGTLPAGLQGVLRLGDAIIWQGALSPYDSGLWRPGQWLRAKVPLTVPVEMAAGEASLTLTVLDSAGMPLATAVSLGVVDIVAIDRLFTLPSSVATPLQVTFGDALQLRGITMPETAVSAGESVTISLFWEVIATPQVLLSAFVHVVGSDGQNLAQGDQWPGGLPINSRASGEIIVDTYTITIPPDAAAGMYDLGVGVYVTESGTRLSARVEGETAVPDNRFFLPMTLEVLPNE